MAVSKQKWLYDDTTFADVPKRHHKVCVHEIIIGDVEDPEIYLLEGIREWRETEKGKFTITHSLASPSIHRHLSIATYCYTYNIVAYFDEKSYTYYKLRFE